MSSISVTGKNWIFKKFNTKDVALYSENYSLSEIAAKLLAIRKKNINSIDLFLKPKIKNYLPNPFKIKDMQKAIERTCRSIENSETIAIFGDYDVDGATSTAILSRYFLSINQKIKTYIPDRQKEGYGVSLLAIEYAAFVIASVLSIFLVFSILSTSKLKLFLSFSTFSIILFIVETDSTG